MCPILSIISIWLWTFLRQLLSSDVFGSSRCEKTLSLQLNSRTSTRIQRFYCRECKWLWQRGEPHFCPARMSLRTHKEHLSEQLRLISWDQVLFDSDRLYTLSLFWVHKYATHNRKPSLIVLMYRFTPWTPVQPWSLYFSFLKYYCTMYNKYKLLILKKLFVKFGKAYCYTTSVGLHYYDKKKKKS